MSPPAHTARDPRRPRRAGAPPSPGPRPPPVDIAAFAAPALRGGLATLPAAPATLAGAGPDPAGPPTGPPAWAERRYRVLRPHARGALGEVFVAHDEELNREVALKEIQAHHSDNRDSRGRFLLEAEITGRLEHPGIVPVYGLGSYADGRTYYAMSFYGGETC